MVQIEILTYTTIIFNLFIIFFSTWGTFISVVLVKEFLVLWANFVVRGKFLCDLVGFFIFLGGFAGKSFERLIK